MGARHVGSCWRAPVGTFLVCKGGLPLWLPWFDDTCGIYAEVGSGARPRKSVRQGSIRSRERPYSPWAEFGADVVSLSESLYVLIPKRPLYCPWDLEVLLTEDRHRLCA